MPDLIFFFDGGGRWVLSLAITLALTAGAIWAIFDDDSPLWSDEDEPE